MSDDKQNLGPLLAGLGARRIGVEHWTEHDFEMERIGREQNQRTYARRLEQLEAAGWVPFQGPFYYARREFHGGHLIPDTKKRVPTKVAFAMFRDQNPDVALEPYRPHPHGWTSPPSTRGLIHQEIVSVEPMKVPTFGLFAMKNEDFGYGTENLERADRWRVFCAGFTGVRSTGTGSSRDEETGKGRDAVFVTLDHDADAAKFPAEWEGRLVVVRVKAEADELAEKKARREIEEASYREESEWLRKARIS
jgi:hypothetical protein